MQTNLCCSASGDKIKRALVFWSRKYRPMQKESQSLKNISCRCLQFSLFKSFLCLSVCAESTKGSEPRGASQEEDEWAGVLVAPALTHHPFSHPQQTRKGTDVLLQCSIVTTRGRHESTSGGLDVAYSISWLKTRFSVKTMSFFYNICNQLSFYFSAELSVPPLFWLWEVGVEGKHPEAPEKRYHWF